jgi:hypothetical protein
MRRAGAATTADQYPSVLCVYSNTPGANTRQFALRKIPLSLAIQIHNPNTARAALSRMPIL